MKEYLLVKLLSLQEEAKIIRRFENRRKRAAARARELYNIKRVIERHQKDIVRLKNYEGDNNIHKSRIVYHENKIKWLERQANKIHALPSFSYSNLTYNEQVREGLYLHRIFDVRKEARATNLAYGFLQGHEYNDIEKISYSQPAWDRIETMILKYGEGDIETLIEKFKVWKETALNGQKENHIFSIVPGSVRRLFHFAMDNTWKFYGWNKTEKGYVKRVI